MKERKISFKYNFQVYYSFAKKYKFLFFVLLLLVLILETKNVIEKYLFKIIIDNGTAFQANNLTRANLINILLIVALVFISVVIIQAIARYFLLHILNRMEAKLILDLKSHFFNHILDLDHNFHISHKTGSLISRLSRGGRAVEKLTDVIFFNFAPLLFQATILIGSLVFLDSTSALIIAFVILVFTSYSFIIQKLQQSANLEANETEDIEKANVADIFTNIDSVKYFGRENYIKNKYKDLANKTKDAAIRHWDYFKLYDAGQITIISIGTLCLIFFSLRAFLNNEISLGTITFIYSAFLGLLMPLNGFIYGTREIYRSMADFEDLFSYGKIKSEIKDKPNAKPLIIKKGTIEYRNVEFNYGKRNLLKKFNLKIAKNKKVALVGHSGSGKTSLIKLLYRLFDVKSGKILIDNKDIRDFTQESIRSEMAIVPQECILFDDTIYNNIAFSNPLAKREEVLKAIKFARMDKIIAEFPNKEETLVGERGIKLSGGEKQRVSIARAILANKKVLVLDEATSSLDSEIEHEIQQDLQKLMKGRTSIVIAHRLSTIMKADIIVVMKHGRIVQMGNHKELIKKKGEYSKLWNLQKGGYIK